MLDTGARHFVGAMLPDMFLNTFMKPKDLNTPAPRADFSKVHSASCVPDMSKALIQAVEKAKVCPTMRLFRTRTKKQWLNEVTATPRYDSADEWASERQPKYTFKFGPFPALAARKRPRPRKGAKRKVDIIEAYDFATALLDIEVHDMRLADPFTDPGDEQNSSSSSKGSPSRPVHARPAEPSPLLSPHPERSTPEPNPPIAQPGPSHSPHATDQIQDDTPSPARQKATPEGSPASSYYAPFENPSPESTAFRTSLVAHAAAQFARRHHAFFFQLIIVDRWARFIRWDRSGAIASERFDYVTRPDLLSEFFWRFSHLTDEERGLDSTVALADAKEKQLFKNAVQEFLGAMKAGNKDGAPMRKIPAAQSMLDNMKAYPVSKIHIVDPTTRKSTDLLVGRPLSDRCPMFGRSTRAYIAYDLRDRRLVFLKDTWRVDHPKLSVESNTYRELKKHKIPHTLDVLYGSDVCDGRKRVQETLTQVYAQDEDDWRVSDCKHERYVHHRIVQDIAYPLESALDVREFIQVLHDILTTISTAFEVAGIVHRDISVGNIMIDSNGRGVLIDWDHAGSKDEVVRGVGTWRFMSYLMLSQPDKPHEVTDDLESVFWLLVFGAMKWYALPDQDLPIDGFDQCNLNAHGHRTGGSSKGDWIHYSDLLENLRLTSGILHELIKDSRFCWSKFHNAKQGAPAFKHMKEFHAEVMEMLDLAGQPAFWLQKYKSALSDLDAFPAVKAVDHEKSIHSPSAEERQAAPPSGEPHHADARLSPRSGAKRMAEYFSQSPDDISATPARKRRRFNGNN